MLYFIFFFVHFIIADENIDKNDNTTTIEQANANDKKKNLSSNEKKTNHQQQENTALNDLNITVPPSTIPPSHIPQRTLKRMNATRNIPKYSSEDQSTTVGFDHPEEPMTQTQKINPLRRRNAKANIPKIELNEETDKNSQEQKNTKDTQPNPDFSNEEAFRDDPSDPFDEEDDEELHTEGQNSQIETEDKTNETPTATKTSMPIQTDTPTPVQTKTPTPTETSIPKPTEEVITDDTIPDFEELSIDDAIDSEINTDQSDTAVNSDSNIDEASSNQETELKETVKKKYPKFHIVSISPQTVSTRGDEKIEITMNTTLDGPPFIKFGENKIVHGRHSKKDLTVKCRTPRLQEGEINMSVSIDKIKWSEPFSLIVVADEADLPWIFVACAGIAIIAVSLMVSKLVCGKRAVPKKKKSSKYHDDDLLNIMAPNYSSNNLRKRTKNPIEV